MAKVDLEPLLDEFPQARHGHSYFDSDTATLLPSSAFRAITDFYGKGMNLSNLEMNELFRQTKRDLAGHLGLRNPEEILLGSSISQLMSVIASAVAATGKRTVVIGALEHEGFVGPWIKETGHKPTKLRVVAPKEDWSFSSDSFASAIDGDTAAVLVSHISDLSGVETPLPAIAKVANKEGALLIVDLTHSCFRADLSSVASLADVTVFPSHTALGPFGLAVCMLRPKVMENMGKGSKVVEEFAQDYTREMHLLPNVIALNAGLVLLRGIGTQSIRETEFRLMRTFFDMTTKIEGLTIYGPPDPSKRVGLICFKVEGLRPEEVSLALEIGADAVTFDGDLGLSWAQQALKGTDTRANRLSLYIYNTDEQVRSVAEVMSQLSLLKVGGAS